MKHIIESSLSRIAKASDGVEEVIIDFFKNNPNPDDPDVHELAGKLGLEPEILEKHVYRLLTKLLQENK